MSHGPALYGSPVVFGDELYAQAYPYLLIINILFFYLIDKVMLSFTFSPGVELMEMS